MCLVLRLSAHEEEGCEKRKKINEKIALVRIEKISFVKSADRYINVSGFS